MGYDSAGELHERKEGLVCLDEGREQTDREGRAFTSTRTQRRFGRMTAAINGDGSFRGGFKNGAALIGRMSTPWRDAPRKFRAPAVRVFPRTRVRGGEGRRNVWKRGRGQVPLETGGYQREREPGGTPLRDVSRGGPLEESRGHSITF